MRIGLVGYQGSGKSSLFQWLTRVDADPAQAHTVQSAMAAISDPRVDQLCDIYSPKKITLASLELLDTPGLSRSHEGNAARLSQLREADCLVLVVDGFSSDDPLADLTSFDEDLLLADMEIVSRRVEKLRELVKKPRPSREKDQQELDLLEPLETALEAGKRLAEIELSEEQERSIRSFQLFSTKPRLVVFNLADDETEIDRFSKQLSEGPPSISLPVGLALELSKMDEADRAEFVEELEIEVPGSDGMLQAMLDASEQILYFTAGEKEVRSWLLHRGGTAVDAADGIHTDLARGFVRAETMTCDDLVRLGSEREVKAENLLRRETKEYVVQDGDILHILSNV